MGILDIGNASASDLSNAIQDFSVAPQETDSASESKETRWSNEEWAEQLGYYKGIPELRAAIDAKATWTVGKGFTGDIDSETIMSFWLGWGKDTANTLIENMIRTYYIGGDSYCEIIRDEEENIINLKPLDPKTIVIIANAQGIITGYEQTSKNPKKAPVKFDVNDIFHLARNRVADEIHGVSIIDSLKTIILARNEAIAGYKQVMQRYMKPRYIFHLDTDNSTKIANFKTKMDKAWADGENIYIPKDAVVPELMALSPNATLNPLQWIESLNNNFYEACGTPKIILGNSGEFTEATAKIVYLAFQQNVEEEQLFVEEQFLSQLGLTIKLEFPASLENELLSDKAKDGAVNIDASETTVAPEEINNEQKNTEQS